MRTDMDIAFEIVSRAKCLHVAAVHAGAVIEFGPKAMSRTRTYFSSASDKRENQHKILWWSAIEAFASSGVKWMKSDVRGRWLEPHRRRVYAETEFTELRRVNDVLDRVRVGILEALADEQYPDQFATDEGRQSSTRLLRALATRDYPAIASLCEGDSPMRERLQETLGITDDEIAAMALLDGEEWQSLGASAGRFERYYQKRSA